MQTIVERMVIREKKLAAKGFMKGDIVGSAAKGLKYWEAEVIEVGDDYVKVRIGRACGIPILWKLPKKDVFLVWRK